MRAKTIVSAASILGLAAALGAFAEDGATPGIRQEIFRRISEGRGALFEGNAKKAADDLCWASRRALNSHDAAWYCGRAKLLARDPEGAVKALRLATDIDPQHLGSWVDLGDALLAAGRPAEARPAFYKALTIRKDYSAAYDGLARLAQRTGKEQEALEMFAKALEANPADARARLHRGQLHQDAGRLDQAVADIAEAARLRPDDADVQLGYARVLLKARQPDDALAASRRAAALRPKDARVPSLQSEIFLSIDALAEAEESARAALALDPSDARARGVLGEVLGRRGRIDDALAALIPPAPGDLDEGEFATLEAARAKWDGRGAELRRLDEAARAPDATPDTLLACADARLSTGDTAGAAELAQRATPALAEPAALRRAALLLGRAGRPSAAAALLEKLGPAAGPVDAVNLGVLLEAAGDAEAAQAAYRRALGAGDNAEAHAGLARLAVARGDRAEAVLQLKAYLAGAPPAEFVAHAKEALARLEGTKPATPGGASATGGAK